MKKMTILLALCLALGAVLPGSALAATTFDGTVVSGESVSVTAPFGGTVDSFTPSVGDRISEGDSIASVKTTKVYASIDGTVTGVFGQPGDTVSDVVSRVGAVLYLEPLNRYTITADIQHAYNDSDNKYINIGETLYIRSYYTSNGNTAVGKVVAVDGVNYTVETTEGDLLMQETVSLYRDADYTSTSRVGRGTVSRTAEVAVGADSTSASGSSTTASSTQSILTLHVKDGDTVERGQLLYETVSGALDGLYATGNQIVSDVSGIVATVGTSTGSTISKGDTLITVYPADQMLVEIAIDEYDLTDIHEGDQLQLTFSYDDSTDSDCVGTVKMISHASSSTDTSDVTYLAYVTFPQNDNVRLGMTVVATPLAQAGTTDDTAADAAADTATGNPAEVTEEAAAQ